MDRVPSTPEEIRLSRILAAPVAERPAVPTDDPALDGFLDRVQVARDERDRLDAERLAADLRKAHADKLARDRATESLASRMLDAFLVVVVVVMLLLLACGGPAASSRLEPQGQTARENPYDVR